MKEKITFSPKVVMKMLLLSIHIGQMDQGSINCPAQNNSGLRIANDYFAEKKHHTNPDYPSDVQTPIHNYFD